MLTINITGLSPGIHEMVLEPTPEALGLDPTEFSNVSVAVRLDYDVNRALVQFTVTGVATLICDRTLVSFTRLLQDSYVILFSKDDLLESGDELDDVQPLAENATELDITEPVRDTLLLALPLRRVAPQAEEAELPLTFGKPEDSLDPRWEALRSLK